MKTGLALEVVNYHVIRTGTYHAFDFAKYAPRYLGEVAYRFNSCFDLKSIINRLIRVTTKFRAYPL
mgnify:CR=1 FL=1